MSANTNRTLIVALVVIVGLFVLFGGGAMTGGRMGGDMMGNAWMGGFGWMWISAVLVVGLGVLFVWGILGKKP